MVVCILLRRRGFRRDVREFAPPLPRPQRVLISFLNLTPFLGWFTEHGSGLLCRRALMPPERPILRPQYEIIVSERQSLRVLLSSTATLVHLGRNSFASGFIIAFVFFLIAGFWIAILATQSRSAKSAASQRRVWF